MIRFPQVEEIMQTRDFITQFMGYNHNPSIEDGQFYDMKNMSTDDFPFLSSRKPRLSGVTISNCQAFCDFDDDLYWITNGVVYKNGMQYTKAPSAMGDYPEVEITGGKQQIVKLGSKLVFFPSKSWVDTNPNAKYKSGNIEHEYPTYDVQPVKIELNICNEKMKPISASRIKDEAYFSWLTDESETLTIKNDLNNGTVATVKEYISASDASVLSKIRVKDTAGNYYVIDSATSTSEGNCTITFSEEATIKKNAVLHIVGYRHIPKNGQYMLSRNDEGQAYLQRYSSTTDLWTSLQKTYFQIKFPYVGNYFHEGDHVKLNFSMYDNFEQMDIYAFFLRYFGIDVSYLLEYIFPYNEEEDKYENTLKIEKKKNGSSGYIIVPGILDKNYLFGNPIVQIPVGHAPNARITVKRECPDMDFVVECSNRIWGCNSQKHEIYCSRLGDCNNWRNYEGVSTDAWAATVGSEGRFTGCANFLGMPMFFKENSMIKVSISANGGHGYKEYPCRGVQRGSHESIQLINEKLYYKGVDAVCVYDGSFPVEIGSSLGGCRYKNAIGGKIRNRYMVSMIDEETDESVMFSYDTKNGLWSKEDDLRPMYMVYHLNDLIILKENPQTIMSLGGIMSGFTQKEGMFDWMAQTGNIGFETPDRKYITRLSVRTNLSHDTKCRIYIQYDSNKRWDFVSELTGLGTDTYTVPIHPRRCDHFSLKFEGEGHIDFISMTKTYAQGSDR